MWIFATSLKPRDSQIVKKRELIVSKLFFFWIKITERLESMFKEMLFAFKCLPLLLVLLAFD